jgi:hypothetical protein
MPCRRFFIFGEAACLGKQLGRREAEHDARGNIPSLTAIHDQLLAASSCSLFCFTLVSVLFEKVRFAWNSARRL